MTRTLASRASPPDGPVPDQAITPRAAPEVDPTLLATRLKRLIGAESVSSFARRSGVGESVLRSYLADHRMPSLDKALALAVAAGVTLDWLATGQHSRTMAQLRATYTTGSGDASPSDGLPLAQLNIAVLEGILKAVLKAQGARASPAQLATLVVDLYLRATATNLPG